MKDEKVKAKLPSGITVKTKQMINDVTLLVLTIYFFT